MEFFYDHNNSSMLSILCEEVKYIFKRIYLLLLWQFPSKSLLVEFVFRSLIRVVGELFGFKVSCYYYLEFKS